MAHRGRQSPGRAPSGCGILATKKEIGTPMAAGPGPALRLAQHGRADAGHCRRRRHPAPLWDVANLMTASSGPRHMA